ncbi:MAG TPA: tetratricopeptide repeat protein [Bacteroidota bacterium]
MKRTALWFVALLVCAPSLFAQDFLGKGKVALSSHDTATAVQAFKDAVKAGQKTAEANYYLGAIAYAHRHLDEAQTYLEASLRSNDENADALAMLADVYVARKNAPEALATYRKAQKAAPKSASVATGFGMALLAADSVDAAIVQLTKAKDLDANNPAVYAALGDAYLKQNVAALAITNYRQAIALAPKQFAYRYRLAEIYEKSRQYGDAVNEYDSIATLDPSNPEPLLRMSRILSRTVGNQKRLAITPLRKFVRANPRSVEGWTMLSKVLYLTEEFDDAWKAADTALQLNNKNPDLWRQFGSSIVQTREPDTAKRRQNLQRAVNAADQLKKMNAFKQEDQGWLGIALAGLGRDDEAMQSLLAADKGDSTGCDLYFPLASIYMKKQDWTNATKYFEKKLDCDPRSLSAYINAAASYMQLKNWGRARQLLDTALALKPDFLQTRLWLARYFLQVDSLERAKEQYDRVLTEAAADPVRYKKDIAEAHYMIGAYNFTVHRYTEAIESYRRALAAGYNNGGLHLSWGQAILQTLDPKEGAEAGKKKKEDAVNQLRQAVQMEPNNAAAHLWLGQALILSREEGNDALNRQLQSEACGEFKKVLRLQPSNTDAKKSMERYGCK